MTGTSWDGHLFATGMARLNLLATSLKCDNRPMAACSVVCKSCGSTIEVEDVHRSEASASSSDEPAWLARLACPACGKVNFYTDADLPKSM
jgi:hypothetical protein